MSAGLVSYKLCDRAFDCEHCPLDAALRGGALPAQPIQQVPPSVDGLSARVTAFCFPDDRLYGEGHTWVQEAADRSVRVGLDAFAGALLGTVRRVIREGESESLIAGGPLCALDLGIGRLELSAPVGGRLRRWNEALEEDGDLLAVSPYDEGWIVEMEPTDSGTPGGPADLVGADGALDRTRLDLRRFRRRAAMFLFDDAGAVGPTMADGGEMLTDLRFMLGPRRYLDLVGDLVR